MFVSFLRTSLAAILLAGAIPVLQAQDEVRFRLEIDKGPWQAGEDRVAVVRAQIAEGWHLYSMTPYPPDAIAPQPTTIRLAEESRFELSGPVTQPQPKISHDENFGIDTEYFDVQADFEVPIRVTAGTPAGEQELTLLVRYMACNDRLCLPPQIVELKARIAVLAPAAAPVVARVEPSVGEPAPAAVAPETEAGETRLEPALASREEGSPDGVFSSINTRELPAQTLAYVWFAMIMGGLALLTPCVFPMIPITVSYFTKREVSRRRAVGDGALYSLGIILTFTLIGFLLTFLFGVGGINRVASSPLVNLVIATIFVVFALSLFGVLDIRLPSGLLNALNQKSSKFGGSFGILLMALTFSLTSFTCTVPFVGTVMVAATQGDWLWSMLGVAAFATVFSAPFFLLALFPSFLKSLPKSGGWMDSLKITMGFLELAAALKFLSNVDLVYQWELITRPVFITVWLAIALVTAIYLLGKFYFPHEVPAQTVGAGRVLSATLFLAVGFYLLRGLIGFPLGELDAFLPPRDYGETASVQLFGSGTASREELVWLTNYERALEMARIEGKPVFIDFTGYTCTNCRWMEANVFERPEVQDLFRQYVLVRLYTDGSKPEHAENLRFEKERFGTIALPLYALMSPLDEILATFPGLTRNPEEFVSFLESGLRKSQPLAQAQKR